MYVCANIYVFQKDFLPGSLKLQRTAEQWERVVGTAVAEESAAAVPGANVTLMHIQSAANIQTRCQTESIRKQS